MEFDMKIGQQWRKLGLGRWNKSDVNDFTYHRVRRENNCIWTIMTLIIKDHTETELTKQELLNVLVTKYEQLVKQGYGDLIKKVFIVENKKHIVEKWKKEQN